MPVQLGKHFWPAFSFAQGLRIDYLSPTVYLTDLIIIGILINWLVEKVKSQKSKVKITSKNSKVLILFLCLLVFLLINCLFAQNQGAAFYLLIKIIEFVFLGIYIIQNHYQASRFSLPVSISVIYSSLFAVIQFLKQKSLGGIMYWLGERTFDAGTPGIAKAIINGQLVLRPYATFPHPNALAGFLLVGFILSFPYWWKRNRSFSFLYIILVVSAIFLSFSRSVWLAGILILVWIIGKKVFLSASLIIGLIFIFAFSQLSGSEAIFQRVDLNIAAIKMFQQSPILGVGLNNFIVRLPEFWNDSGQVLWYQAVHNIFLLVLAETGFVGLVLFLWLLFQTLKRIPASHFSLLASLSVILFLGLFDHYWLTLQSTQLLFTIVLGLSWSKPRLTRYN